MFNTPEYRTWNNIRTRCTYSTHNSFKNYGARGIRVCKVWSDSFVRFFRDVGLRPSSEHELDRIDNDKDYEPGNVRWVTHAENNLNTRRTVKHGDAVGAKEVAKTLGMSLRTYFRRRQQKGLQGTTIPPIGVQL